MTPNSSKNTTEENSNRKHSVPDSSLAEDLVVVSQRNALTPIQDHKNQPLIRAAQNKPMLSPHKADVESEKGLKEEVDKWRIFGKMMAESYDDLNKKYTEYTKDKEKDKKIVSALKEQVFPSAEKIVLYFQKGSYTEGFTQSSKRRTQIQNKRKLCTSRVFFEKGR